MPNCYTALEELVDTFGGPWLFGLVLLALLILLALVLSVARTKYVSADEVPALVPPQHGSRIDHSFPFLESLNEVHLQFHPSAIHFSLSGTGINTDQIIFLLETVLYRLELIKMTILLFFRLWKQIEMRSHKVMCTECILWGQTLLVNLGIFPILLQNKL